MITYYLYKLWQRIKSEFVSLWLGMRVGIVGVRRGKLGSHFTFANKIVLGFWDTRLMHLGDQLFHIGLVRACRMAGLEVIIVGGTPLKDLFQELGAQIVPDVSALGEISGAIVITKHDLLASTYTHTHTNSYFLGIDYVHVKGDAIGDILITETQKVLEELGSLVQLENKQEYWELPQGDSWIPGPVRPVVVPGGQAREDNHNEAKFHWQHLLDQEKDIFIYNDFVASSGLFATFRKKKLQKLGVLAKEKGHALVYVGTDQERSANKAHDFIAYDVRGMITPLELFTLVAHPHVRGVITFDTFPAHVTSLVKKELFVVIKRKATKKFIARRFMPMSRHLRAPTRIF